jgi:hypothetical protein
MRTVDVLDHFHRELLPRSPRTRVTAGLIALILGAGGTVLLWVGRDGVRIIWSLPILLGVGGFFLLTDGLAEKRRQRQTPRTRERIRERDREILSRLLLAKKEGRSVLRTLHDLGVDDPAQRRRYFQMLEWMLEDGQHVDAPGGSDGRPS